ncbi:peptide chain release factor 2 [Candidatus Saccharibacteria bacterium RIFCSPHIGHO2_01_FULL_49_21]|nr:MAG: peptide chain release factor 2 [Candidatus Saccharibacteria bacterium RIFCSPHIGHO2_01_FULL_49_21]
MEELAKQVKELRKQIDSSLDKIELADLAEELARLQAQMQSADFWQNAPRAQTISKEAASLARRVEPWQKLQQEIDELEELMRLGDASMEKELTEKLTAISQQLTAMRHDLRFSGPYDDHDVILSIYAGAGGTDAQDWAQMLLRTYTRWAESSGLKVKTVDQSVGEGAGIKSVTVELSGGDFLYGKLAGEHGVHRLVRLSPFNADHLRQTSFAKVEVVPLIDRPEEAEIAEKDLKIDVFRSAGAGGQSVNTTDSAVRVTHLPTGITVAIQNERSQLQNKETALAVLRSKLIALQLEQHAKNLTELKGPSQSAEWGNQIRSYVLHPYKQVKDLRTGYETSDPEKVLDGHIERFIDAWLERLPTSSG